MVQEVGHRGRGDVFQDLPFAHPESLQILHRKINPSQLGILGDVAEDVGELEGDAQLLGIAFHDRAGCAEDPGAEQADHRGDPVAVGAEFLKGRVAGALRLPHIHEHATHDLREQVAVEMPPGNHFAEFPGECFFLPRLQCQEPCLQQIPFLIGGSSRRIGDVIDRAAPLAEEQGIFPASGGQEQERGKEVGSPPLHGSPEFPRGRGEGLCLFHLSVAALSIAVSLGAGNHRLILRFFLPEFLSS